MFDLSHLTPADLRAKILQAHAEKRLFAQNHNLGYCGYSHPNQPNLGCAIGVCMTPEQAAQLQARVTDGHLAYPIYQLAIDGHVKLHPDVDPLVLMGIQDAHDKWWSAWPRSTASYEVAFLQAVDKLCASN